MWRLPTSEHTNHLDSVPDFHGESDGQSDDSSIGLSGLVSDIRSVSAYSEGELSESDPDKSSTIRSIWSTSDVSSQPSHDPLKKCPPVDYLVAYKVIGLDRVHAGPLSDDPVPEDTVLVANGDAQVTDNLTTQTVTTTNLFAENATLGNLVVSGGTFLPQSSLYFAGENGSTGADYVIRPEDNVDVVYVNPINGTVNVYLGTGSNNIFPDNKVITFKDVTLEFGQASSYNVNIIVRNEEDHVPVRIEHYFHGLRVRNNSRYVLDTSGGAVTFRFAHIALFGAAPTWVIQSQFAGNSRLLGRSGVEFKGADDNMKGKIINLK